MSKNEEIHTNTSPQWHSLMYSTRALEVERLFLDNALNSLRIYFACVTCTGHVAKSLVVSIQKRLMIILVPFKHFT